MHVGFYYYFVESATFTNHISPRLAEFGISFPPALKHIHSAQTYQKDQLVKSQVEASVHPSQAVKLWGQKTWTEFLSHH